MSSTQQTSSTEQTTFSDEFLTLARLALSGRQQDIAVFLQKTARHYRNLAPGMTERLIELLREAPSRSSPLRRDTAVPVPVDTDSRLQLVRVEQPTTLDIEPILNPEVAKSINQVVAEHGKSDHLIQAGLNPSRAVLFVGPPGVGKTLSARWIASRLQKPLLILDLSAVMSSFLGRTGGNVRAVIDYAKSANCILFLDELDAVAKRRDDSSEIGELKRLVTVLLQEIDDWPGGSLLLAATNHPDLLDPAIWRRFDQTIQFPGPTERELHKAIETFLGPDWEGAQRWLPALSIIFRGLSFNDVERALLRARRQKVITGSPIGDELAHSVSEFAHKLTRAERIALGQMLQTLTNMSDHKINDLTGVSRITLRKRRKQPFSEPRRT